MLKKGGRLEAEQKVFEETLGPVMEAEGVAESEAVEAERIAESGASLG